MGCFSIKDGRWVVQYRKPGEKKKTRIYFGRGEKGEEKARVKWQEIQDQKLSDRLANEEENLRKSGLIVAKLLWLYYGAKFDAETTNGKCNRKRIEKHLLPQFGNEKCLDMDKTKTDAYVKKRSREYGDRKKTRHVKQITIRRELSILKAAFNWAADPERKYIPYNPIYGLKLPPKDGDIIQPLSDNEARRIYKNAAEHVQRGMVLGSLTGVRIGPSELFSIEWVNVDMQKEVIFVVSAKKGGLPAREVPINSDLKRFLLVWQKQDMAFQKVDDPDMLQGAVVHYFGRPINTFKKAWRTAKKKAGIKRRVRPYDIRHTFVSNILRDGADLKATSQVIGHSRVQTTVDEYQHVCTNERRVAAEKARSPFDVPDPSKVVSGNSVN